MNRGAVLWLIPIAICAYALRTIALFVIGPRAPRLAAAIDAYWLWTPLVVVVLWLGFAIHPIVALVAALECSSD